MIFSSLDLAPEIQQALDACGYSQMTAIQQQAIIPARRGKDLLANAQTGTGKTAAFALPMLQRMYDQPMPTLARQPRALILAPTRELAEQLATTINRYAQFMTLTITALCSGAKISAQQKKLNAGIDIVVATPGRLLEHLEQGNVDLGNVEFVVLDEADRMLDMGFIDEVYTLLQKTRKERQTLLFSATISPAIKKLANTLLINHKVISVNKQNTTADTVEHAVYAVGEQQKAELFIDLIEEKNWFKVLVFTSTKAQADALMSKLKQARIKAAVCHSDKTQGSRRRALTDFKADKIQVLVATEVAARGLDIQGLEHVVNYNLPYLAEDYIHRIGRTGRAGNKGQAISFVSREEERALNNIERLIGERIKRIKHPGYATGSRETLLNTLAKNPRPARSNRAGQKKIFGDSRRVQTGRKK
jgi:superfamily II DNA/RNA helicase